MYTAYDALYGSMKNRFTVVDGKMEYSLGEYMRNKAERLEKKNTRPAAKRTSPVGAKAKTVKITPPERTLTSFPMRTVASAFVAVASICLAVLPILGVKGIYQSPDVSPVSTVAPTVLEEENLYTEVNL